VSPTDLLVSLRRQRLWIALLAACALFLAQLLIAGHETEHIGQVDDGSCEICLVAALLGSPLPQSLSTPAVPYGTPPRESTLAYDPVRQILYPRQRPRAPPTPIRL
jgi:hypothetical protein